MMSEDNVQRILKSMEMPPAVPIQSCLPFIRIFSDIPMERSYTGLGFLSQR